MKIYLPENLEWLREKIEFERKRALNLRRSLGVRIPGDFETYVHYGDDERVLGRQNKKGIILNIFEMLFEKSTPFQKKKFDKFLCNLNLLEEVFEVGDLEINSILENSKKKLIILNGSQNISINYSIKKERDLIEKLIKKTNKSMQEGIYLLKKNFEKIDWITYSHELDHIDFSRSFIFQNLGKIKEKLKDIFSKENQVKEDLEEICKLKKEEINKQIWIHPAMEARAFYCEFDLNILDKENFMKKKAEIKNNLLGCYTQDFHNENILSYLIATRNKYNPNTINYLINKFGEREVKFDSSKVNYELAIKLYYYEIPKYQFKIAKNSLRVIDATGKAFLEDPSRLEIACETASNFKEYLNILNGKSS